MCIVTADLSMLMKGIGTANTLVVLYLMDALALVLGLALL
jgi:hypothetical protein